MNAKERFIDIFLGDILPPEARLVTDKKKKSLILLRGSAFVEQEKFPQKEYAMLMLLCEAYPRGVKYETLLAVMKEVSEREALAMLKDAIQVNGQSGYENTLRPVRTLISRLRLRLLPFKVGIKAEEAGYYMLETLGNRMSFLEHLEAEIASEKESA